MTMAPDLSFRGAKRRGNLKQAVTNPPGPSYDAAVYREIAPQGHFPALRAQGATAPAEPRNDKLGGLLRLKEGNDNLGGIPDLACK